jgi:hypothetical protein
MFLEFDEEEIVAQLGFAERGRVATEVLVNKTQLAIVGVTRSIGVVMQRQQIGKRVASVTVREVIAAEA